MPHLLETGVDAAIPDADFVNRPHRMTCLTVPP
jgi:hypothetical protein